MLELFGSVITGLRQRADSLTYGAAMAVVAFCSGFISFTHISALTQDLGGSWKVAHLMPFCVDGQIVIGSSYFMHGENWKSKTAGLLFGVIPGIGESLVANWESGAGHGYWASGWDTVPAQAFACSMILFERWLHKRKAGTAATTARVVPETISQAPEPVAPAAQEAAPALVHVATRPAGAPWGLVSPAAAPAPVPAPRLTIPTYGPVMTLPPRAQPKARPAAVDDTRLPLPDGEDEVRQAVRSMTRNDLWRTYRVSKHKADQLREQYLNEREVA